MAWDTEIPIIVRSWINDLSDQPVYSNERIRQLIVVAARYVITEVNLNYQYAVDIVDPSISPDPTELDNKDIDFIGFVALKASCLLDQSTFRTRAATEGIRASLGPASLSVGGSLSGFKTILDKGPCALYEALKMDYEIGNANGIKAILSPFVGNNFDPRNISMYSDFRSRDFYR